jgi:uncharacterized protein
MSVHLRGHHLLCMLTYVGEGYDEAFVENFTAICKRIGNGEAIIVVDGPDDVCAPQLRAAQGSDSPPHCFNASCVERDKQALNDISDLMGSPLRSGDTLHLTPQFVRTLRVAFAEGVIRNACRDCEWHSVCSHIAATDQFLDSPLLFIHLHKTVTISSEIRAPKEAMATWMRS